jgi:5-methylcytosine-specific restriction endonuclease McrA
VADPYEKETLSVAVAASQGWADLMRRLGLKESGGRRKALQKKATEYGLDTGHFKKRSPWRKYPDEAIAAAVATSSTFREVVAKLGATPASGTISHIARRIAAAGIDVGHFPGVNRIVTDLPFTAAELSDAASSAHSIRGVARILGVPDDSRSRAALGRMLRCHGVDTTHFNRSRLEIPEAVLRLSVPAASSYADVMRALDLPVTDTNHRRIRRRVAQLGLDTHHFKRTPWANTSATVSGPRPIARDALVLLPQGSVRASRPRLHRALQEIGVAYQCTSCGNSGEWLGQPLTLQIDHVNGDWLDNRAENLRYLCPNCHSLTATWCRNRRKGRQVIE